MNKQIMFITEDGVEIYKGDSYFRVWNDLLLSPRLITNAGNRDNARWKEENTS